MSDILGDIEWTRGDSYPLTMTIKNKKTGEPVNLNGYSFKLAVDPDRDPETDTNQLFQVDGAVNPNFALGEVTFTPTADNTNFVKGTYWFGVQMMYGGAYVRTIAKYKWKQSQDINK